MTELELLTAILDDIKWIACLLILIGAAVVVAGIAVAITLEDILEELRK